MSIILKPREKQLSPRAKELIRIAKDKVSLANASFGSAVVAIQDVYYHLLYENYTQQEAGDICRRELVDTFSDRTIRRALPEVAKHTEFANKKADKVTAFEHENELVEMPSRQELSKKVKQQGGHITWQEQEIETLRATVEKLRSGVEFQQLESGLKEELKKVKAERNQLLKENQDYLYRLDLAEEKILRLESENKGLKNNKKK